MVSKKDLKDRIFEEELEQASRFVEEITFLRAIDNLIEVYIGGLRKLDVQDIYGNQESIDRANWRLFTDLGVGLYNSTVGKVSRYFQRR